MSISIGIYQALEQAGFTSSQVKAQCDLVEHFVESKLDRIESKFQNLATKDDLNHLRLEISGIKGETTGIKTDIKYLTYFGAGIFTVCATPALYNAWIYVVSFWKSIP